MTDINQVFYSEFLISMKNILLINIIIFKRIQFKVIKCIFYVLYYNKF